jgi:CubicO group peptidase (beta-lactamase class C family)
MSTNVQFNVASVSKAITAVALLQLLYQRQDVSLDDPFFTFLPSHWQVHNSLRQVSFKQLLNHTSGFRFKRNLTYHDLKTDMEEGINSADIGTAKYEGENFAIMRMLIPALAGRKIPRADDENPLMEMIQAQAYAAYYIDYIQDHLLVPAGLSKKIACHAIPFLTGMCYHFPYNNKQGTDFGDDTLVAGSKGWVMSAAELARLFRTVHHTEKIIPGILSDRMKNQLLGYDVLSNTGEGMQYWWKNGGYPGAQNAGELNSLIICYANGVQVAMIINSELSGGRSMMDIVNAAFDEAYSMTKVNAEHVKRP